MARFAAHLRVDNAVSLTVSYEAVLWLCGLQDLLRDIYALSGACNVIARGFPLFCRVS